MQYNVTDVLYQIERRLEFIRDAHSIHSVVFFLQNMPMCEYKLDL